MQNAPQIAPMVGSLVCAGLISFILLGLGLMWAHERHQKKVREAAKEEFVKNVLNKGLLILALHALVLCGPGMATPDDNNGQVISRQGENVFVIEIEESMDLIDSATITAITNTSAPGIEAGQWVYFDVLEQINNSSYKVSLFEQIGEAPAQIGAQVGLSTTHD